MTGRRAPMAPPVLDGYEHVSLLGSGGYSDVYLYRQLLPEREVAVKVLLSDSVSDASRDAFTREANVMAALSTHPFIVTILHAAVSGDGRPFLVMEYYPGPNFGHRMRTERFTVAEVLRTGVEVASAVETAHRSGVLHRDIKPANILVSEYGRPGLTDFGIAGAVGPDSEAEGMSVPWSPPEIVAGDAVGDVRSDVYSLSATVYSLLAGRSPFEDPSGSNRPLELIDRIVAGGLPPTGRSDVPESLERLLRQAMSKDPARRPVSAHDFGSALQDIESELSLAVTPMEIRGQYRAAPAAPQPHEDRTNLKTPTVVIAQPDRTPLHPGPPSTPLGTVPDELHTIRRGSVAAPGPGFISPPPPATGAWTPPPVERLATPGATATIPEPARPARSPAQIAALVLGVIVLLGVVSFVVERFDTGGTRTPPTTETDELPDNDIDAGTPTPVSDIDAQPGPDGRLMVTWTAPPGATSFVVVSKDGAELARAPAIDGRLELDGAVAPCDILVRTESQSGQVGDDSRPGSC